MLALPVLPLPLLLLLEFGVVASALLARGTDMGSLGSMANVVP